MQHPANNIFEVMLWGKGYTYSVTTLWYEILQHAEYLFGERDKRFAILGVELNQENQPQTWYPYDGCVVIQLTQDCWNDMDRAIFQLAHEIVHCLCPKPGRHANVLEEGLATYFSEIEAKKFGSNYQANSPKYLQARNLVIRLLEYDKDIIKKTRVKCPDISSITKENLKSICAEINDSLLDVLLMPFCEFSKQLEYYGERQ